MLRALASLALLVPAAASAACPLTTPMEVVLCITEHIADFSPGDISALAGRVITLESEAARSPGMRISGARFEYDVFGDPRWTVATVYGDGFTGEIVAAAGGVDVTLTPGAFAAPPVCTATAEDRVAHMVYLRDATTTDTVEVGIFNVESIADGSRNFEILCIGPE